MGFLCTAAMGKPFTMAMGIQLTISILPAIEKHAVKFDLGRPYRCTPGIQALADAYVGGRTEEGGGRARGLKEKDGREPLALHGTVTSKEEAG